MSERIASIEVVLDSAWIAGRLRSSAFLMNLPLMPNMGLGDRGGLIRTPLDESRALDEARNHSAHQIGVLVDEAARGGQRAAWRPGPDVASPRHNRSDPELLTHRGVRLDHHRRVRGLADERENRSVAGRRAQQHLVLPAELAHQPCGREVFDPALLGHGDRADVFERETF